MTEATTWDWLGFSIFVAAMLVLELAVFHRHSREMRLREAAFWTVVWYVLALLFNGVIWYRFGSTAALQFLTGYLVEKSLSMDNVFVFAVIFGYFSVPLRYQYRVLFWGILGAIVMRLIFILVGVELITRFEWVLWIFGGILIISGLRMALQHDNKPEPEQNFVLRLAKRWLPVSRTPHGEHFFVREAGRWCVTPLFLVLLVIESTDVVFAIDSVPAIFGITQDPYLIFTSNIFAILGLRALYFLLAGVMDMFRYLHFGLAAVLVFVGIKMLLPHEYDPPDWMSLLIIVTLLGTAIAASLVANWRDTRRSHQEGGSSSTVPPTTGGQAPLDGNGASPDTGARRDAAGSPGPTDGD